mgnify:CR=1 FL=1
MSIKINPSFYSELLATRPFIVKAAQKIYDNWDQSDDELSGGICDDIEEEISSIIMDKTSADETILGGQDGDDHAWTIAKFRKETYGINIPANVYEIGAGYSWKKRENVKFTVDDIEIFKL